MQDIVAIALSKLDGKVILIDIYFSIFLPMSHLQKL